MENYGNTITEVTLFRCVTDTEVHIIAAKDIISMKPIISQDNDPYIRIEFEDDEMYITNTIYCSEVELYTIN
jgi:hypothetical protein